MTFAAIDYIFAVLILLFVVIGVVNGFVKELFGKASWVLGIIGACIFYDDIAKYFTEKIKSSVLCDLLGFIIIFVLVFLVFKLLEIIFSKLFEFEILNSLDRALGFLLGIAEGIALICLIIFVLKHQTLFSVDLLQDSFFCHILGKYNV